MAISKRLLIHNATAYTKTGIDADHQAVYGGAVALENVRCAPAKQNAFTALGEAKNDRLTLVFDCTNSRPKGFVPAVQQRIEFAGQPYTVRSVTPFYGRETSVHHYEAALV